MWKWKGAHTEWNCQIFDTNIFDFEWISTGERIELIEPRYNQKKKFSVYTSNIYGKTVKFASCELSNNVYGFYIYEEVSNNKTEIVNFE